MKCTWLLLALPLLVAAPAFAAADGVVLDAPEIVVLRQGLSETVALPGQGYSDFVQVEGGANFTITGIELPAGAKRLLGHGVTHVRWQPRDGNTAVQLEFSSVPLSSLINATPGTQQRPHTPQVIAGFSFSDAGEPPAHHPVVGSYTGNGREEQANPHGDYKLPAFPKARYSDVLVSLKVTNVDFRDVLWLLSDIGNVSIVLDPYWAEEPTGGRRPPGGGADPGNGGGDGSAGGGFRPGGDFIPTPPREGTGQLSLNFHDVPFDQALELVLMAVNLYKVEIWPSSN
jgi:hypothetical protein